MSLVGCSSHSLAIRQFNATVGIIIKLQCYPFTSKAVKQVKTFVLVSIMIFTAYIL